MGREEVTRRQCNKAFCFFGPSWPSGDMYDFDDYVDFGKGYNVKFSSFCC